MCRHVKVQSYTSKNAWNKINFYKNIADYCIKNKITPKVIWQYHNWKNTPQKHFNKPNMFTENQVRILMSIKISKISNNKTVPIVFDNTIADWISLCKRKLNILLFFTVQSYIKVLKVRKLSNTCSFLLEISKKRASETVYDYSEDIDFKYF